MESCIPVIAVLRNGADQNSIIPVDLLEPGKQRVFCSHALCRALIQQPPEPLGVGRDVTRCPLAPHETLGS